MASSPSKVESRRPSRHDQPVREKLGAAIARIRFLELMLGLCGLLVGVFVYGQVMAFLDVRYLLPEVVRQIGLVAFLAVAGVWSYLYIYRPLRVGINPYYAARVIEEKTPGSQNGLLNWLDLHDSPEAGHARGLLGQRARKEAEKADLEKAINGDAATWSAAAATLLFLFSFILALLLGPRSFLNSLNRVFMPFSFTVAPTASTKITLIRPEGDGCILVGQAATITARLEGRIPAASDADAAKVRFRHSADEPWRERPMNRLDAQNTWEAVIPSNEIENGIDYHVTAGNAKTPTYRISVEAVPMIEEFRATYHFRHYTGRTTEVRRERPLDSLRGTVVELRVKTNRRLAEGSPQLELDVPTGKVMLRGSIDPEDATAFRVKLPLEESGEYRLHFVAASTRRDTYVDPQKYPVIARPDELPEVELTLPARDIQLPANGGMMLEGWAADKEGLQKLVLQMRVIDGPKLRAMVYRELDTLRQKQGNYPTHVKYKEYLDLTKLRDDDGKAFAPQIKQQIEYWLEATDACDLPGPSRVVASKRYRVEVVEADPDAMGQGDQRKQAEKDKGEHAKKQDQEFAQEDAARKEENDRKEKGEKPGQNPDGANNQNQPGNPGDQKPEDNNTLDEAQRIKDELNRGEQKKPENQPGEGKEKGDQKEQGGQSKEGGEGKDQKAEQKEGANAEQKEQAGQGKDQGGMNEGKQAEKKEAGQPNDMGENKPEGKDGGQQNMNEKPGEQKPGQGENKPGEGKEQKGEGNAGQKSERKEGGNPQAGKEQPAEGKDAGQDGQGQGGAEKKTPAGQEGNPPMAEKKEGGERSNTPAPPAGKEPGQGEQPGEQKSPPQAEGQTQGATTKPGGNKRDPNDPKEARPEDVEKLKNQAAEPSKDRADAAGKELERIEKDAADPMVREAAKQAREEAKEARAGQCKKPGGADGMGQGMGQEGGAAQKPGAEEGMPGGAGGKPEAGMGQQNGQKVEPKEPGPDGMGGMGGGDPMKGENAAMGKGPAQQPVAGGAPGQGVERVEGNNQGNGMGEGGLNPDGVNQKAAPAPATELQLRKFKEVYNNPDQLKDLRISPEDFEKFLKRYEEMVRRPGNATEKLPPSQTGGNLPAISGSTTNPNDPGAQPSGPGMTNRPQAPPGYREAYRELLRQLSQPDR